MARHRFRVLLALALVSSLSLFVFGWRAIARVRMSRDSLTLARRELVRACMVICARAVLPVARGREQHPRDKVCQGGCWV